MMISRIITGSSMEKGIEKILRMFRRIDKRLYILFVVVEIEGGTDGRRSIQKLRKDLGAVGSASDKYAFASKVGSGILGKDTFDIEGNNSSVAFGVVDIGVPVCKQSFYRHLPKLGLLLPDFVKPDPLQVAAGLGKTHRPGDVLGSGFEPERDVG